MCKKARFPSWENLLKTASTRQMTENCIPSQMTGLNTYILLSKVKVDILYQKVIFYVILVIIVKLSVLDLRKTTVVLGHLAVTCTDLQISMLLLKVLICIIHY